MHRIQFVVMAAAVAFSSSLRAAEPEPMPKFGHIRGRIVYDGAPPAKPAPVLVAPPVGPAVVVDDESLLVNPDNRGIANVFVWLYLGRDEAAPAVHPSYIRGEHERTRPLNVSGVRFEPRATAMWTDERLLLDNKGVFGKAVSIEPINGAPKAPLIPPGGIAEIGFKQAERLPLRMTSPIHPWMSGYLLVQDHPYFAVTNADGEFEIRNLPVGERTLRLWHEKSGYVTKVQLHGREEDWQRGRLEVKVEAMTTNLGDIAASPKLFTD